MTEAGPIMVYYAILQIKFLKDLCFGQSLPKKQKKQNNVDYLYEMKKKKEAWRYAERTLTFENSIS